MLACVAAMMAVCSTARAEPASRAWDAEARAAYVVLGGARQTGGLMPSLAARRSWQVGEKVSVSVGGRFGIFGLGGGARWIGVLGGPMAAMAWRAAPAWSLSVGVDGDVGRVPVCNRLGLCLRFIGLFPAAEAAVGYAAWNHVDVTATLAVRAVNTLAWSGPTFEPALGGRFYW